ncbi:MAG: hypothetical protein TYPL_3080 [Candidatus Tyloplasma litorale]|nr:MAG: hypothetical protein TYPL_3080 [Mycoplasmatales bacterium]
MIKRAVKTDIGTAIKVAKKVVQIVLKTINPAAKSSTPSYLLPNNQFPSSQTSPTPNKPLIKTKIIIIVAKNNAEDAKTKRQLLKRLFEIDLFLSIDFFVLVVIILLCLFIF